MTNALDVIDSEEMLNEAKSDFKDQSDCDPGSTLISHNITINGRRTSVRLEKEMWLGLKDIARRESCKIHDLCSVIAERKRPKTSLTAAIRVFVMVYYQAAATETGHLRAGHGCGSSVAAKTITRNLNMPYYGLREFKYLPPDRLQ